MDGKKRRTKNEERSLPRKGQGRRRRRRQGGGREEEVPFGRKKGFTKYKIDIVFNFKAPDQEFRRVLPGVLEK